jgi:invasion protein IalB
MLIDRALLAKSTIMLALVGALSHALAQQPVPQQPAPKAPAAPKAAPGPPQKGSPAPAAQQKGAPSPAGQQPAQPQGPQLTFSPWAKVCPKPSETNSQKVCFTGKDGRVDTGLPLVAAVVIEAEGQPKKMLRITVPLGMALQPGTRVIVDDGQPISAPYVTCIPNGCMSDYEASQELIDHMKKGKGLALQAINQNGQPVSVILPLADFAKAHDGPPMDQKDFEELQRKLQQPRPNVN